MNKHDNLIDLKIFSRQEAIPRFAVFYCESEIVDKKIFTLTPSVMQWSDEIYLVDLKPSKKYWQLQAQRQKLNIFELFEKNNDPDWYVYGDQCFICGYDVEIIINKTSGGYGLNGGVLLRPNPKKLRVLCEKCYIKSFGVVFPAACGVKSQCERIYT